MTREESISNPPTPKRFRINLCVSLLVLVTILGFFVRSWGVSSESVWFDEFTSLVFLRAPQEWTESPLYSHWEQVVCPDRARGVNSLPEFLVKNRSIDPATMPVYDTLEYMWNRYVSSSPLSQRYLSIFFGILIIPLIYLFGKELFGSTAGLIAALCVALSPVHRYYAQEIHMYVHVALLALASAYTFMKLIRDGRRRWWAAHLIVNVVMIWTHMFAALLPLVEGLFLVVFYPRGIRRIIIWGTFHAAMAVSLVIFATTIQFWSADQTASWQKVPTNQEFFGDLLSDDCIGLTYQIRPTPDAFESFCSPEKAKALVNMQYPVGRFATWFFIACAFAVTLRALWRYRFESKNGNECEPDSTWKWCFLLIFCWLLPAIILYIGSIAWRPIIFPRYTIYSSLFLYLLIGGAIASFKHKPVRLFLSSIVILFYGYETMMVLGGPQRSDWLSAAKHVRENSKPDDLILVQDWMWKRVFSYNLGPVENVMGYGKTLDVLAEEVAHRLETAQEPATVWAVIQTYYFAFGPSLEFEQQLDKRGITHEFTEFGGMQHVLVYRLTGKPKPYSGAQLDSCASENFGDLAMEYWRSKEYDEAVSVCKKAIAINPKAARIYAYMGMAYKELANWDEALAAFQKGIEINPDDYLWNYTNVGEILIRKGRFDEAIATIKKALERFPNYSWGYSCMGYAYLEKKDFDSAISAFKKGIELDQNDPRPKEALQEAEALKANPNAHPPLPESVRDELKSIFNSVMQIPENGDLDAAIKSCREIVAKTPLDPKPYVNIAELLLVKGDTTAAMMSFRKAFELNPDLKDVLEPLTTALFDKKDYDAAWKEVKSIKDEGFTPPPQLVEQLKKTSGRSE